MYIPKATKYLKESLYRSNAGHSIIVTVELVGVPRAKRWAGQRTSGLRRVLNFCCTCLKMQRVMLNLRV